MAAKQNGKSPSKSIEKIYQKKSQLEHILLRPDTYIGSIEYTTEKLWVMDLEKKVMVQKDLTFVPGLYKIFDEILVNAADNKQRDKKMNCIKIEISQEQNTISVWNNGEGIPVAMHKDEKMYVPTMIFGHLLTSSNYNDEEQKVTGGRNGYGAKLCNIFSTMFSVETASKKYKKHFKQIWGDNMSKVGEPKIREDYFGEDFTKISFSPDLTKFKMDKLDDDMVALISRRAYDVAATSKGVSVFLNGEKLPVKNFKDYIDLYIKSVSMDEANIPKIVYETPHERWEIAATISERGFQQVSFVNSIATTKGGRHVDYVVDMIIKQLLEVLKKKNKGGVNIKPFQVKNHIWVFVNCLVVNPTFDSQTKENMTLQAKNFGSKITLSDKFITSLTKSGIIEMVLTWAKFKAQTELSKTSGKKQNKIKGVPKLEDANNAGSRNSMDCTLILTEGDSAKTLAVSGLSVVGRDNYGVFPLRGKLLNVREATHKQILENVEINNVIKILGLQYKMKYLTYDDLKALRYGKLMIMTDQDQDGSHIKGLLINFIHTNWPELLRLPFLEEFITPIVKVKSRNEEHSFYSLPEFEEWRINTPNNSSFHVKYYKGLGTSTSKEAKEYFQDMDRHRILFKYDGSQDDDAIVMAFSKKCCDQRKIWLTKHMDECKQRKINNLPERYLYTKDTKQISYQEFVNLELVLFSNCDNVRSIPCAVDGLKPGQRKVLFTCIKRNDKREVKVAQLAGSVAEKSAYHHGEASLCGTIVNLAQNYVGSNNINILQPNGQFGTRLQGGKDSASPRYIFTMMSPLTRFIFHPHDDPLLNYLTDDSQRIEPSFYMPIIPMVLVNGAEGIGTGWSTKIPNFNPQDLVNNLRRMIQNEEPKPMQPWYKNFTGSVDFVGDGKYLTNGNIAILSENKLEITELPIGTWTQAFKENCLEPLSNGNEKVKAIIADYKEYHTDTTVRFVVTMAPGELDRLEREEGGFHRTFKLSSSLSTNQMHAFDSNDVLKRYENVSQILKEFFTLRMEFYEKRKAYMQGQLEAEAALLSNQARFILEKCNKTLVVENKKRKVMIDELIQRGYDPDPVAVWKEKVKLSQDEEEVDEEEEEEVVDVKPGKSKPIESDAAFNKLADVKKFNYLMGMAMWMLTEEKKNAMLQQRDNKLAELNLLKAKTPQMIWIEDLDAFEKKLKEVEKQERDDEAGLNSKTAKAVAKLAKASGADKKRGARQSIGVKSTADIYPSKNGQKVAFKVTADVLKKYEKLAELLVKSKTKAAIKNEPKDIDADKTGEIDEFDLLVGENGEAAAETNKEVKIKPKVEVKPKPEPKKRAPKGEVKKGSGDKMKQSKIDFSGAKKTAVRGKKTKGSGSDEPSGSEVSDIEPDSPIAPRERATGRRVAAAKAVNYAALLRDVDDDDEDDSEDNAPSKSVPMSRIAIVDSDSEDEPVKKKAPSKSVPIANILIDSDSEDEPVKKTTPKSDDNLFDSLREDDEDAAPKKKVASSSTAIARKNVPAKSQKRAKITDDSSDDDFVAKKGNAKRKKKGSSDSEDDDDSDFNM